MNMVHKVYDCVQPMTSAVAEDNPVWGGYAQEYQVSAWMAMGSDTVNLKLRDGLGWYEYVGVVTEKLSDYAKHGVKTMDDLIQYLYWVVPS
jgi:hypothetical protein